MNSNANVLSPDYELVGIFIHSYIDLLRRFHSSITPNQKWLRERSHESYAKNYSMLFPHDEPLASRNMRRDPFHQVMCILIVVHTNHVNYLMENQLRRIGAMNFLGEF